MSWETIEPARGRRIDKNRWAITIGANGTSLWLPRTNPFGGHVTALRGKGSDTGWLLLLPAEAGDRGSRAVNATRGSGQFVRISNLPFAPAAMSITTVQAVPDGPGYRVRLPWLGDDGRPKPLP
jgi:hypothetical protein